MVGLLQHSSSIHDITATILTLQCHSVYAYFYRRLRGTAVTQHEIVFITKVAVLFGSIVAINRFETAIFKVVKWSNEPLAILVILIP